MIAAVLAVAAAVFLVLVCANPIWLGAVITGISALIPISFRLKITAISLSTLKLHGIRIFLKKCAIISIETITINIWPLRISVINVQGCIRIEDTESLKTLPFPRKFLMRFIVRYLYFDALFTKLILARHTRSYSKGPVVASY